MPTLFKGPASRSLLHFCCFVGLIAAEEPRGISQGCLARKSAPNERCPSALIQLARAQWPAHSAGITEDVADAFRAQDSLESLQDETEASQVRAPLEPLEDTAALEGQDAVQAPDATTDIQDDLQGFRPADEIFPTNPDSSSLLRASGEKSSGLEAPTNSDSSSLLRDSGDKPSGFEAPTILDPSSLLRDSGEKPSGLEGQSKVDQAAEASLPSLKAQSLPDESEGMENTVLSNDLRNSVSEVFDELPGALSAEDTPAEYKQSPLDIMSDSHSEQDVEVDDGSSRRASTVDLAKRAVSAELGKQDQFSQFRPAEEVFPQDGRIIEEPKEDKVISSDANTKFRESGNADALRRVSPQVKRKEDYDSDHLIGEALSKLNEHSEARDRAIGEALAKLNEHSEARDRAAHLKRASRKLVAHKLATRRWQHHRGQQHAAHVRHRASNPGTTRSRSRSRSSQASPHSLNLSQKQAGKQRLPNVFSWLSSRKGSYCEEWPSSFGSGCTETGGEWNKLGNYTTFEKCRAQCSSVVDAMGPVCCYIREDLGCYAKSESSVTHEGGDEGMAMMCQDNGQGGDAPATAPGPAPGPAPETQAGMDCANMNCSFTKEYNCPGQSAGSLGDAEDDGSAPYYCCCKKEMWKAEDAKQAEIAAAVDAALKAEREKSAGQKTGNSAGQKADLSENVTSASQAKDTTVTEAPVDIKAKDTTATEASVDTKVKDTTATEAPVDTKVKDTTATEVPVDTKAKDTTTTEANNTTTGQVLPSKAPTTKTTAGVLAGSTEIPVANASGFLVGDSISISSNNKTEYNQIAGFGSIILKHPLNLTHPAGATIVKVEALPPEPDASPSEPKANTTEPWTTTMPCTTGDSSPDQNRLSTSRRKTTPAPEMADLKELVDGLFKRYDRRMDKMEARMDKKIDAISSSKEGAQVVVKTGAENTAGTAQAQVAQTVPAATAGSDARVPPAMSVPVSVPVSVQSPPVSVQSAPQAISTPDTTTQNPPASGPPPPASKPQQAPAPIVVEQASPPLRRHHKHRHHKVAATTPEPKIVYVPAPAAPVVQAPPQVVQATPTQTQTQILPQPPAYTVQQPPYAVQYAAPPSAVTAAVPGCIMPPCGPVVNVLPPQSAFVQQFPPEPRPLQSIYQQTPQQQLSMMQPSFPPAQGPQMTVLAEMQPQQSFARVVPQQQQQSFVTSLAQMELETPAWTQPAQVAFIA